MHCDKGPIAASPSATQLAVNRVRHRRVIIAKLDLRTAVCAVLLTINARVAVSQTSFELWPEVDIYWRPSERQRSFLEISTSTEREGDKREGTIGLYQDYLRLPGWFARVGYRYTRSLRDDTFRESRGVAEINLSDELMDRVRWVNRVRSELRWVNGDYSWRLRDRVHVQYRMLDSGLAWAPYGTVEAYYDSKYRTIARIGGRLGTEARLSRRVSFDVYLARQNNSRTTPRYVTALGLVTKLFYP